MAKGSVVWDDGKAASNAAKHGVSFEDAAEVFEDALGGNFFDDLHSEEEDRYLAVGRTERGRVLVVSYTYRGDLVRLISARPATRTEIRRYMNIDEVRDGEAIEEETETLSDDDVDLSKLDWSKFRRGFPFTLKRGPKWVRLDDTVRVIFHGSEEVNEALRKMMHEGRSPAPDPEKRKARRLAKRKKKATP